MSSEYSYDTNSLNNMCAKFGAGWSKAVDFHEYDTL